MEGKTKIILTIIQILIALGVIELMRAVITHFVNKKNKHTTIKGLYKLYTDDVKHYIDQTKELQETITDTRIKSIEMEKRLIEMDKKLDDKNQLIISLSQTTKEHTRRIEDLLRKAKLLETIKCERDNCPNRMPPFKTIQIK